MHLVAALRCYQFVYAGRSSGRGARAGRDSTTVVRDTSDGSRFFAAFGPPFDAQRFFGRGPLPGKARRLRKQLYARGNPAELFWSDARAPVRGIEVRKLWLALIWVVYCLGAELKLVWCASVFARFA